MNYQITYEDALRICEAYKNFNFYKSEFRIGKCDVVTFNYFLCDYKYFINPLIKEPHINALDMRGVTFVFHEDGRLYKRFLMLKKFFNVNQVEETQIDKLQKKQIKSVTIKEDGSLIAFMNLPDKTVFAKTQAGFTNEQSIAALQIYNTDVKIKKFVDEILEADFTPLFEYVAYDNRIVLKYSGKELRLIGIRDNDNGAYYSAAHMHTLKHYRDISTVKTVKFNSLDQILDLMKTSTDMEGVVVEFEDDQLVKFKTEWYCNLHGIRTVNIFREDFVIQNYLNETLDDATQELNMTDDADAFKFIDTVISATTNWSNFIEEKVDELVESYNSSFYNGQWIKFATDKHKSAFFGLAKVKISDPELYRKRKVEFMLKSVNHLNKAKQIVEHFKNLS